VIKTLEANSPDQGGQGDEGSPSPSVDRGIKIPERGLAETSSREPPPGLSSLNRSWEDLHSAGPPDDAYGSEPTNSENQKDSDVRLTRPSGATERTLVVNSDYTSDAKTSTSPPSAADCNYVCNTTVEEAQNRREDARDTIAVVGGILGWLEPETIPGFVLAGVYLDRKLATGIKEMPARQIRCGCGPPGMVAP
jgi:hypothetical protein